jgi:hypothetical protein
MEICFENDHGGQSNLRTIEILGYMNDNLENQGEVEDAEKLRLRYTDAFD